MSTVHQRPPLQVSRYPHLQSDEREAALQLIDAAPVANLAWVEDGWPRCVPVAHARVGEELLLHGSRRAGAMVPARSGAPLVATIYLLDGVVFAQTLFDSTLNYRCVVAYGTARLLEGEEELDGLRAISEKLAPGRWQEVGAPTRRQRNATAVVALPLDHLSLKLRSGGPDDEAPADLWTGHVPISMTAGPPVTQPGCRHEPSASALATVARWREG